MSRIMRKVCVCGHFGFNKELLNGQTVKTKSVTSFLEDKYGKDEVLKIDTHGKVIKLISLPFKFIKKLFCCKNIIILPAHNGLRVIAPLLLFENVFFKRKLHYAVIGGWLPEFLKNKPVLSKLLKSFDFIYVETNTMKQALVSQGFLNVEVMRNFKELVTVESDYLNFDCTEPLTLCTFSRVMKEKGIEDAIEAVKYINNRFKRTVYKLDIYGQIESSQEEWFKSVMTNAPDYVAYKGVVPYDKSVDVLKDYFALLFPTHFYTEGVPGTIIDCYAAGVPVIASKWESCLDVVDNYKTGIYYDFSDFDSLVKVLISVAENPEIITKMKPSCVDKASLFLPENAMKVLFSNL